MIMMKASKHKTDKWQPIPTISHSLYGPGSVAESSPHN